MWRGERGSLEWRPKWACPPEVCDPPNALVPPPLSLSVVFVMQGGSSYGGTWDDGCVRSHRSGRDGCLFSIDRGTWIHTSVKRFSHWVTRGRVLTSASKFRSCFHIGWRAVVFWRQRQNLTLNPMGGIFDVSTKYGCATPNVNPPPPVVVPIHTLRVRHNSPFRVKVLDGPHSTGTGTSSTKCCEIILSSSFFTWTFFFPPVCQDEIHVPMPMSVLVVTYSFLLSFSLCRWVCHFTKKARCLSDQASNRSRNQMSFLWPLLVWWPRAKGTVRFLEVVVLTQTQRWVLMWDTMACPSGSTDLGLGPQESSRLGPTSSRLGLEHVCGYFVQSPLPPLVRPMSQWHFSQCPYAV